jgi:hypothetical protein
MESIEQEIENTKKEIETVSKALLKYCHHEDCNKWLECPENHYRCKKPLGLDTSIAWKAGNMFYDFNISSTRHDLALGFCVLTSLHDIVAHHALEFSELHGLLDSGRQHLERLLSLLGEVEVKK